MAPAVDSALSTKHSALILFAHGARDAQWSEPFRAIRQAVATRRPDLTVELAFLELMQPALADCVAQLVKDGHTLITVAPLFLAQGGHLKKDLPRQLKELSVRHAAADITVLPPIGEVTELLNAISEWLVDSAPR
jgi:sirohydrochlorin cobaltochelatase